jgi:dihydropyrimidinase
MKILIKNGTLVTAADSYQADLLIEGEKIGLIGANLAVEDAEVVDAGGKLVLPGGIDVHTHLELPVGSFFNSDDFYTGHKAAAFGGTTCHLDFAHQDKGGTLRQALDLYHEKAGKAVIDYGFHIGLVDVRPETLDEIPAMVEEGVSSLKLYLAYKGRLQVDDAAFFKSLMKAAELGMVALVHAENGDVIELLIQQALSSGRLGLPWHARTRPAWSEAEATMRAVALAGMAGASLYVVHVTCQGAVDQLAYGRERGLRVMGETCTQYLFFTEKQLERPDGAKWVCAPPLRREADIAGLWQALANRTLQAVSTDHCPFMYEGDKALTYEGQPYRMPGKELGQGNFSKVPNGVPGIEDRLVMLWSYGVGQGRISANRFVELTATNPAKIFGMYPRKGTLAVGSDADIVIWDPRAKRVISAAKAHQRVDYNLYEGWEVTGLPEKVYGRGRLLVDGEQWYGRPGQGAFIRRSSHNPAV